MTIVENVFVLHCILRCICLLFNASICDIIHLNAFTRRLCDNVEMSLVFTVLVLHSLNAFCDVAALYVHNTPCLGKKVPLYFRL